MNAKDELNNWFTYHRPTGNQPELYEKLRAKAKEYAELILDSCPPGLERDKAVETVRDASMWANAAIACGPSVQSNA